MNCATTPGGAAIKFHPGSYIFVPSSSYGKARQSIMSLLDSVSNDANVAGVEVPFKWAELESDKAGDYSAGFALVDSLLAKLASLPTPKRLMLVVGERAFGTAHGGPPVGLLPQYIIDMPNGAAVAPNGVRWAGSLVAIARLDNPAVMDRLIALAQAYGNRYNSNPLFEMFVPMGESAVSSGAGFDSRAYITQIERLYAAAAQAWPNTALRWYLNWLPVKDEVFESVLMFARTLPQSVVGGPDPEGPLPLPADQHTGVRTIQSNRMFRGLPSSSGDPTRYEDQRGKMPWVSEIEQAGTCCGVAGILPADFADYAINVMHASYLVYTQNTYLPGNTTQNDPHKWVGQLAFIDATHGAAHPQTPASIAATIP